jgi:hypothetical protein
VAGDVGQHKEQPVADVIVTRIKAEYLAPLDKLKKDDL